MWAVPLSMSSALGKNSRHVFYAARLGQPLRSDVPEEPMFFLFAFPTL